MTTIAIDFNGSTFTQTAPASPAYVQANGDIDIAGLAQDDVIIAWTLTDGKTFRTSGSSDPVTISGNGHEQVFKTSGNGLGLSNGNKTLTIQDSNSKDAGNKNFHYTLHESPGDVDPSIKNR